MSIKTTKYFLSQVTVFYHLYKQQFSDNIYKIKRENKGALSTYSSSQPLFCVVNIRRGTVARN